MFCDLKSAYLTRGGSNVIVVDWGPLATSPCYFSAIFNLLQVGSCTSRLLLGLVTKFSLRLANVHVVGFSLGAHVAALASNSVQAATGSRLGRVTGTEHCKQGNRWCYTDRGSMLLLSRIRPSVISP